MSLTRTAILAAVERDGRSIAALARAAGVPRQVLSPYLAGKRTITADTLDRLLPVLGLALTPATEAPREKWRDPAGSASA